VNDVPVLLIIVRNAHYLKRVKLFVTYATVLVPCMCSTTHASIATGLLKIVNIARLLLVIFQFVLNVTCFPIQRVMHVPPVKFSNVEHAIRIAHQILLSVLIVGLRVSITFWSTTAVLVVDQ
jgi:hypothetical protein